MTQDDAIKIAAAIRAEVDSLTAVSDASPGAAAYATDALKAVAETAADLYAATQRMPDSAKQAFMIACGL